MPEPTKIPSPSDILGKNSIPSPSDILGDNEKKKSTSTVKTQKSVSETPIGSSGGKGFPKIDTNSVAPGLGVQPNYELEKAKQLAKSKRVKELEVSFYASTKDNTDDAVAEQRLQDRKANKGFWNTAEDLTKKAYNTVIDAVSATSPNLMGLQGAKISEDPFEDEKKQALLEAKKNKITLTETQKNTRAEEIFKEKEKDNLFIDRANSYLDNLDVEDKNILEQSRADKAVHLQEENLKKFKVVSAMEMVGNEKIKEYQNVEKQLLALKEKNQSFPQDLYDKYIGLSGEIKQIGGNIQKYSDQIQKNKSDLGTIEQEFDLFKRGYGDMDNFIGNAIATTGELANGIFGAVNYVSSLSPDPIARLNSMRGQEVANKISGKLDEYRGALRKPVESIESAEGFVNYASDLVANQLPILAVTSTGAVGLVALGTSTTGQTFTKINQDVLNGKENYSPLQMASIPLLQGGFEVISEIPTLSILKKGSRVISAAANGEIDLIKKSGGEVFKSYIKDFGKEFGGEHITNLGQNFNARYVQGKEDVGLLDNTGRVSKDTAFLTTLLQGSPHVFGAVAKVFQSNQDLGTLDENSRKIIEFSKQLNTEGLSDTEKTVIQKQIDKVTAKSSKIIASTIGKIGDMPNVSYDEIISLNSQAGKIKAEAKEINNSKLPNKKELLASLGEDYKALQIKRSGLIDGSITPFDLLSGNDQAKRLTQASREITKRDNPDGTKEKFEVKPEDAKTLATENYLKELSNTENEQTPPTSETKPQAEVPQQAEAEKVVESNNSQISNPTDNKGSGENVTKTPNSSQIKNEAISPVEDVVATSVEKPLSSQELSKDKVDSNSKKFNIEGKDIFHHASDSKRNGRLKISNAPQFGTGVYFSTNKELVENEYGSDNTTSVKLNIENPVYSGSKEWNEVNSLAIEKADKDYGEKKGLKLNEDETYFRYNKDNLSEIDEIPSKFISDAAKELGYDAIIDKGSNEYENEVVVLDESKIIYPEDEATPETNTPTNGNVQLGASNVGESGNAKPKSNSKSSVQSSVDGGEVKGEVEVSDLDHAKSQIDKGVLSWNGDMSIERIDLGISWADIRKGESDIKRGKENSVPAKRLIEALAEAKKAGGYNYKQGTGTESARARYFVSLDDVQRYSNEYQLTDAEQKEVDDSEYESAREYDKNFNSLSEQEQIEILENYENSQDNSGTPSADSGQPQSKNDVSKEKARESGKKPTTKERIAERIKLSDAKVDNIKDAINGIDSIFGIKIKVDDIEGLNKNGIDIVEVIANIAKQAIAAGIHIDEAINKTIEHLKKTIDFDVNIDDIKEKINPKVEEEKKADNDFKTKSGKKSLLGRLIQGGNPDVITKAVKELGENYDVRNQQEANDEAMAFIDKVGASEALKAIKDGLITNSDVKMLIYDEALTRLKTEISDEINNNPEDREALIQKFQEVSDDFDKAIRDAGQGIAIMNYIYNKNQTLKYNLKKQISDWKRNDPNGEIPADVKAKFEELEQKLKDVEERTKVAEERAKKAEDDLAIKNIKEDVERKNQASKKNKSGLTPQEQNRKKELRNKFARANDVTGIPALLVDPEFREYLGLVLKTAKGDFSNFSNEILKELGKSARQHLPELFANAGGKGDVKVTDLQSITINEEGKIKIPAQMLRDYVEQGYTDIDEIAALIKDDIADEFPDADVRDIRDALTGYGKQINPNKDEITAEVNKLKEYGRLLSAYDDVMNGQMPLKSGLKRPKSEQKARELRRNINRLAKELNLEPIDLEKQWANAIDKVKSHLKNQIEDLDKQIANGEKRKVERTSINLDEEATALKTIRDAKKQILDDLVGKPELTEEQKIASAEKSLETSIKKIQEEIDTNDISFKEKPTPATSKKIEELRTAKKALLETKKQLRQEAGLIEQQRLKTAKTRIKNQIEDLNTKIKNKDFAKKEIKPILADNELNTLRAEKEAIYEEYEKMKYLQELKNRSRAKKIMDEGLEALGLARAVKASLDLGLIGIQLRGFTYSELWRNPKELGRKFIKLFGAIGSQNKTNKVMSELIGHPLHALAKKLDIGMTHPDLRNEVREEMASGNLLHFIWSSPVLAIESLGGKQFVNSKRSSVGDSFINSVKSRYNKLFQNYQVDIKQKEKFSIKEQWKNINAFEAVERGLSIYGNQLRFEEFVRGVERLKAEGKDEINHLEDYKLLASYIRTFSGRAKPAGFELNQKALNVFFFSFKNMASVMQQLNPIYYGLQHTNSTDFKNGNYFKPSVANKMAMATMFKSVVSTSATILFIMASYNAFKDDDEEEATLETDPRSSDFGKIKIGNFRADFWGGYIPLISLYARLLTEETKKSDGTIVKFGEGYGGIESRGDAATKFLINKESPGFQIFHKYMTSTEEVDKATGETYRVTPFGGKLSEEDAYSFYPMFIGSVKQAKEKDYEGVQAFLTAYSILGLGNVQEYESKKGNTPEQKFIKDQAKKKALFELSDSEKDKIRVDDKLTRVESKIKMLQEIKIAQQQKLPYYISKDVALTKEEVSEIDLTGSDESIAETMKIIKQKKKEYNIDEEE